MIEISNVSIGFETIRRRTKKDGAANPAAESGTGDMFALDGVSLSIPEGCVYGILGSNGAGKSTLLRLICGVYRPDDGSVMIDGEKVWDNEKAKEKVFFVNDETVQFTEYTPKELAIYYSCYYEGFSVEMFDRLTEQLGLPVNRRLSTFSKGMKRQAIVALGLSSGTKYLLIDEAFDGLDPAMRKLVKNMITDAVLDRGTTVLISSHNVTEISEYCDRAVLIHKGKIVFSGEIDEIRGGLCKVQFVRKESPVTREEIEQTGLEVLQYTLLGSIAQAILRGDSDTVSEKIGQVSSDLAEQIPLTLEEVFVYELKARGYGDETD